MEPTYTFARIVLLPLLFLFFRWRIIGLEKIPRRGPAIVAPNHISNLDPLCVGLMIDRAGRRPRFLAKASLWQNPLVRMILAGAKQIPVERGTGGSGPIEAAEAALARGEIVVIYPESTITDTDDVTPKRATKTGVARLTLATGVPVYPVAVWGAQWLFGKYRKTSYRFRRTIMLSVGDPMTFDELRGRIDDPDARRDVTDRIMKEVDRLVRELHAVHPEGAAVPERKALKEAAS